MDKIKITYMKPQELVPYANNPRDNAEAVEMVAEIIKNYGFKVPIVIDETKEVVTGHTRLKAAISLGLEEVPVIIADDLTEEQVRAFRLVDNKVAEFSDWDFDLLEAELANISEDMAVYGFDELEDIAAQDDSTSESTEDLEDEELPEESDIRPGDIFQLGSHRVSCGDSLDRNHIKKLLDGEEIDTVYTDPPYGMKKEKDGVQNDNLNFDDLLEFNKQWVPITLDMMKEVGSWYCWGIDEPLMDLYSFILRPLKENRKIEFKNLLTWDKGSGQGQRAKATRKYPTADEKCLFVFKGDKDTNNNADGFYAGYREISDTLKAKADRVGLTPKKLKELTGTSMFSHWFSTSQWTLIPEKQYQKLVEEYGEEWGTAEEWKELKELYDRKRQEFYGTRAYFDATHDNFNNVLHFNRARYEKEDTGDHVTPKPQALVQLMLKSSTPHSGNVLDVFGGSGSTLIACERLGYTCFMNELDPLYVELIIRRWEAETGEKAVKVN